MLVPYLDLEPHVASGEGLLGVYPNTQTAATILTPADCVKFQPGPAAGSAARRVC